MVGVSPTFGWFYSTLVGDGFHWKPWRWFEDVCLFFTSVLRCFLAKSGNYLKGGMTGTVVHVTYISRVGW